jgi:hypothetical protein
MKEPLQAFYPPQLCKLWVLPSLCQLLVSCWILTEDLVNLWDSSSFSYHVRWEDYPIRYDSGEWTIRLQYPSWT